MKEYKGFKIGDQVTITKRPTSWSSSLHREYPLNLSFPKTIIIENIKEDLLTKHIAMTCGNYGWSLSSMIEEGCIVHCNHVKTLPEEYIVVSEEDNNEVEIALYGRKDLNKGRDGWKVIIKNKEGEHNSWSRRWNKIEPQHMHLPVFTYNEWKELFYKTEEMKKEFVLPEKWYIVRNENNFEVINKWAIEHSQEHFYNNGEEVYYNGNAASTVNSNNITTEITFEQFKTHVLKEKNMKAQTFAITGSKALLKAIWEELGELGYDISNFDEEEDYNHISQQWESNELNLESIENYKTLFIGTAGRSIIKTTYDKVFELPQQYNEALAFAKAQLAPELWEAPEVKLPFADLIFTVNKSKGIATCKHGTITKAEIKAVIDAVVSPKAKLLGYDLEVGASNDRYLKFGCQKGTVREAQAILKALE